jgi:hypothetical protein
MRISDVTHRPAVEVDVNALRGEQQGGIITLVNGWHRREKPLLVAGVKVARRLAILVEAVLPCLVGILSTLRRNRMSSSFVSGECRIVSGLSLRRSRYKPAT